MIKAKYPIFLPDGTRAVVKGVDAPDLSAAKIKGVVVNTYHLMLEPGLDVLEEVGGVKALMNFSGLVASDSGGFQIMSLIHQGRTRGRITEDGVEFDWTIKGKRETARLTPERSIETQFALGADIMVCLDYFTNPKAKKDGIKESVRLTVEWAKRSQEEFWRQIEKRKMKESNRPLLFGVIQGGEDKRLREQCANELLKIGFDGYGYGGWPVDAEGRFNRDLFRFNASLTPDSKLRFALGVGKPQDIIEGHKYGYHLFDCVLPTRDARHHRLYVLDDDLSSSFIYINRDRYSTDSKPISDVCDCYTCQRYSRAYLHHLFKIGDSLAWRLSSIHNLRTFTRLTEKLQKTPGCSKARN